MNAGVKEQLVWRIVLWLRGRVCGIVLFVLFFPEGSGTTTAFFVLHHTIAFQSSIVFLLNYF